ncbi:hypothetical protein ACFQ0K_06840 [Nocardioides caeni]|uniref:Uncharacterized protein n=1 Tax=Nocardioides caeni TaxID=574700 RepID=A0A4S8N8Y8_9ACTN|nr:hypothetical protein [Nocardioides caeni]THV12867.1 hypothetical protein E9934_10750 [Nocardioides caeni]
MPPPVMPAPVAPPPGVPGVAEAAGAAAPAGAAGSTAGAGGLGAAGLPVDPMAAAALGGSGAAGVAGGLPAALGGGAAGAAAGGAAGATAAGAAAGGGAAGAAAVGGAAASGAGAVGTGLGSAASLGVGAKVAIGAVAVTALAGAGAGTAYFVQRDDPEAPPSSTPARTDLIRDVDFGNLAWEYGGAVLDFVDGRTTTQGTFGSGDFVQGRWDPTAGEVAVGGVLYVDLDGDGDEDAAGPVHVTYLDANQEAEAWFVWLWDQETGEARQVPWAVASGLRCGDAIGEVRVQGASLLVEQLWRDPDNPGSCADQPTARREKHIVVEDGYPVVRSGSGGWGGYCPAIPGGPALDLANGVYIPDDVPYGDGPPYEFRAAPSEHAPVVGTDHLQWFVPLVDFGNLTGDDLESGFHDGWELALIGPPEAGSADGTGDGPVCAWIRAGG